MTGVPVLGRLSEGAGDLEPSVFHHAIADWLS
jgi:hypothetical protein